MISKRDSVKNNSDNKRCKKTVMCTHCNMETELVWVHGHFQCKICKFVVESCCEGGQVEKGEIND